MQKNRKISYLTGLNFLGILESCFISALSVDSLLILPMPNYGTSSDCVTNLTKRTVPYYNMYGGTCFK